MLALVFAFTSPTLAEPVRPVEFKTEAVLNESGQIVLTVVVSENGEFVSGVLKITYAQGILNYVGAQITDINLGLVEDYGGTDGVVKVAFANDKAINSGGEILKLVFDIKDADFEGYIVFELEVKELIADDTTTRIKTVSTGCTIAVGENPTETFAPPTPTPKPSPTFVVTNPPENTIPPNDYTPTPDGQTPQPPEATDDSEGSVPIPPADEEEPQPPQSEDEEDPQPPVTGGATLIAIAAISAIAGAGALAIRKKD